MTCGRWLRRARRGCRGRCRRRPPWVGGAVDDARDAGEDDRARAHRARLERDVERRVEQAPGADRRGGLADREHLGVGAGSWSSSRSLWPAPSELAAGPRITRPTGTSSCVERPLGLGDREPHPPRAHLIAKFVTRLAHGVVQQLPTVDHVVRTGRASTPTSARSPHPACPAPPALPPARRLVACPRSRRAPARPRRAPRRAALPAGEVVVRYGGGARARPGGADARAWSRSAGGASPSRAALRKRAAC
jgi:hypothetical protein